MLGHPAEQSYHHHARLSILTCHEPTLSRGSFSSLAIFRHLMSKCGSILVGKHFSHSSEQGIPSLILCFLVVFIRFLVELGPRVFAMFLSYISMEQRIGISSVFLAVIPHRLCTRYIHVQLVAFKLCA